jgi:hypothetical protein
VGRVLAERGFTLGHILIDGTFGPHAATEDRLLGGAGEADDLFGARAERLDAAYRARDRKMAAHFKA